MYLVKWVFVISKNFSGEKTSTKGSDSKDENTNNEESNKSSNDDLELTTTVVMEVDEVQETDPLADTNDASEGNGIFFLQKYKVSVSVWKIK